MEILIGKNCGNPWKKFQAFGRCSVLHERITEILVKINNFFNLMIFKCQTNVIKSS